MQIADHSAVITGGASGLGAATARHLVGMGAKVVIADLNKEAGQTLVAELGVSATFVEMDITDARAMAAVVDASANHYNGPQILVCCAGVATPGKVLGKEGTLPLEQFNHIVQINLIGTFNAVRLCAERMAQHKANDEGERGVIVLTASVAAFDGQVGQAAYSASKAGVAGMTLPLAREFARHGIRVMSIAPGIFDTPMLAGLPEKARASLGEQIPFPSRLGQPQEYAALVQHIIENPMLNGEVIRLDGAIRMTPR
ncbi:MAG: 3-hydroxyacyl-CoA dehydrogenase [Chloroflexota bacterium]